MTERFIPGQEFVPERQGNSGFRAPNRVDFSQYRLTREPQVPYAENTSIFFMTDFVPDFEPGKKRPQEMNPLRETPKPSLANPLNPEVLAQAENPMARLAELMNPRNPFVQDPEKIEDPGLRQHIMKLQNKGDISSWATEDVQEEYLRLQEERNRVRADAQSRGDVSLEARVDRELSPYSTYFFRELQKRGADMNKIISESQREGQHVKAMAEGSGEEAQEVDPFVQDYFVGLETRLREKETWTPDELKAEYIQLLNFANNPYVREHTNEFTQRFIMNRETVLRKKLMESGLDMVQVGQFLQEVDQIIKEEGQRQIAEATVREEKNIPVGMEVPADEIEVQVQKIRQKEADEKAARTAEINRAHNKDILSQFKVPRVGPLREQILENQSKMNAPEFDQYLKALYRDEKIKPFDERERLRWLPSSIQQFAEEWMSRAPTEFKRDGEYPLIDRDGNFHAENMMHLLVRDMIQIHIDTGPANPVNYWQKLQWNFGGSPVSFEYAIDNIGLFFRDEDSGRDLAVLMERMKELVWQFNWARQTWQVYDVNKGNAEAVVKALAQQYAQNALTEYFQGLMSFPGFTEYKPISNFFEDGEGFGDNHEVGSGLRAATTAYRYLDDSYMLKRIFGKYKMNENNDYVLDKDGNKIIDEESWRESAFFSNKAFFENYEAANMATAEKQRALDKKYEEQYRGRHGENASPYEDNDKTKKADPLLYKQIEADIKQQLRFDAQKILFGEAAYSDLIRSEKNKMAFENLSFETDAEATQKAKERIFEEYRYSDKERKFFDKEGNFIGNMDEYIDYVNYYREPQKDKDKVKFTDMRIQYSLAYKEEDEKKKKAYTYDSINKLSAELSQLVASWINLPLSLGMQDTNDRGYDKGLEGTRGLAYRLGQGEARKGQNMGRTSAAQIMYYLSGYTAMKDLAENTMGEAIQGGKGETIDFRKPLEGNVGRFKTETMTKYVADNLNRGFGLKELVLGGEDFDVTGIVKRVPDPSNPFGTRLEVDWGKLYKHRDDWNKFRYLYSTQADLNYAKLERDRIYVEPGNPKSGFKYVTTTVAEKMLGYSVLGQDKYLMKVDKDGRYEQYLRRNAKTQEDLDKIDKMDRYDGRLLVRDDPKDETSKNRSQFGSFVEDPNYKGTGRKKIDAQIVQDSKGEVWKDVLIREYAEMLKNHRKRGSMSEYKDGWVVETFIKLLESIEGDATYDPVTDEISFKSRVFTPEHIKRLRELAGLSQWNTIGKTLAKDMGKESLEGFMKAGRVFFQSITK